MSTDVETDGPIPGPHSMLSFASAAYSRDKTLVSNMPKRWFDELPHTHVALDDAIGQGALFCNMLRENTAGVPRA